MHLSGLMLRFGQDASVANVFFPDSGPVTFVICLQIQILHDGNKWNVSTAVYTPTEWAKVEADH